MFSDANNNLEYVQPLSFIERDGNKMPVILLHGSGFSKEVFLRQFASQQMKGHRLIAVDLPGHGSSPDANNPKLTYSYSGLARAVLKQIISLKIERCIVVGWSLGGQVALEMLDNVAEVAGVMAFGAPPATGGPLGLLRAMIFSKDLLLAGKAKHSLADAVRFEKAALGENATGQFVDVIMRTDPKMRPLLSRSILLNTGCNQRDLVENSSVPVCLLQGEHDPFVRTKYMQSVTGHTLYGGETVVFESTGHAPFLEKQKEFDLLLSKFAEAVEFGKASALPYAMSKPEYQKLAS